MQALLKLCRLCGGNINRFRVQHSCQIRKDELYKAFQLHVEDDSADIHPPKFCDSCYAIMIRKIKAIETNILYMHSLAIISWSEHSDVNCMTCEKHQTVKKGGRPKKQQKNRGKPITNSCYDIIQHIMNIALPMLYNNETSFQPHPLTMNIQQSDVQCAICLGTLNSPVQLTPCMSLLCSPCLIQWIEYSKSNECPVCYHHILTTSEIRLLEDIHLRLLHGMLVTCTTCNQSIHLCELKTHNNICGTLTSSCISPHELTATSILNQPVTSPPSAIEQRVATRIVKRMMQDGQIRMSTGGQVSTKNNTKNIKMITNTQ